MQSASVGLPLHVGCADRQRSRDLHAPTLQACYDSHPQGLCWHLFHASQMSCASDTNIFLRSVLALHRLLVCACARARGGGGRDEKIDAHAWKKRWSASKRRSEQGRGNESPGTFELGPFPRAPAHISVETRSFDAGASSYTSSPLFPARESNDGIIC